MTKRARKLIMAAPAQGNGPGSEDHLFPFTLTVIIASATATLAQNFALWSFLKPAYCKRFSQYQLCYSWPSCMQAHKLNDIMSLPLPFYFSCSMVD